MRSDQRLQQMKKIAQDIISDLKKDERTLGIILKGSIVTGKIWEESDIDIVRIVKGKSRPCYWKWIRGVRVEITDVSLSDWMRKKKEVNFEQLEAHLASLSATKIVYDPKGIVRKKLLRFRYPTELKLYLILRGLANAIRYIKSARRCLALKMDYSCYENLRQAVINLAASLFALNRKVRDISKIEDIGSIHYWLEEFDGLRRKPQGFDRIYETVLSPANKRDQTRACKQLWQVFGTVLNFCKEDVKRNIKKLGGIGKAKRKLKLDNLQLEVIRKIME